MYVEDCFAELVPATNHWFVVPTRPVLQTLVSFHKSDVFKCLADDVNFLGRPYACAFSNGELSLSSTFL